MKTGYYSNVRSITFMLMLISVTSTGCKSVGWKMPKMLSWNREPSATTLAGTTSPTLPESPANKYSPSAIASVGAGSSGTSSGNKAPTNGFAGQTSSTTQTATTGMAAAANGYPTGPYQVGGNATRGIQASTVGNATTKPNAMASVNTSPYGGTYGGAPSTPDLTLPNGVKNSLAAVAPTNAATSGYGQQGTSTASATAGTGYAMPAVSYPSIPSGSLPAAGQFTAIVGGSSASTVPLPNLPPATTATVPASSAYSSSAAATTVPTAGYQPGVYQPGTTARPTTYNFGSTSTTPPSTTLPPNTASGSGPGIIPPTAPTTLYR